MVEYHEDKDLEEQLGETLAGILSGKSSNRMLAVLLSNDIEWINSGWASKLKAIMMLPIMQHHLRCSVQQMSSSTQR